MPLMPRIGPPAVWLTQHVGERILVDLDPPGEEKGHKLQTPETDQDQRHHEDDELPPRPTGRLLLLGRRQGPVITQIITRATTTLTAVVTLGIGPPATIPATTTSDPTIATAQATVPLSSQVSGSTDQSLNYLGAILGSVVAFVFIVWLLWYCLMRDWCTGRRRFTASVGYYDEGSYTTAGSSDGSSSSSSDDRGWRDRRSGQGRVSGGGGIPPVYQVRWGWGRGPRRPDLFPPTRPVPRYTQTAHPQIRGVRRFP